MDRHTRAIELLTFDHKQPRMAALACVSLFIVADETENTSSRENNMLVHFCMVFGTLPLVG